MAGSHIIFFKFGNEKIELRFIFFRRNRAMKGDTKLFIGFCHLEDWRRKVAKIICQQSFNRPATEEFALPGGQVIFTD